MLRIGALVLVAMLFAGCETLQPPLPPPVDEPIEIIVEEPPVVEVQPRPEPKVEEPPPPLPSVSIVLTNSQPAYADVAHALTRHFDNYKIYDLDKVVLAVGLFRKGIDFETTDDEPVRLLFLIISPNAAPAEHLQSLAAISRWVKADHHVERILKVQEPQAIFEMLDKQVDSPGT